MIIFDCEIQKAILKEGETPIPDVQYCSGFDDFARMGISVIGVYNYADDSYRIFGEFSLDEFAQLVKQADVICGFNNLSFDNKLLAANDVIIPVERSYDLMAELKAALGHRISLNSIAEANNLGCKNGNGALAPVLYQQGDYYAVADYCLNDVRLTKRLIDKVIRQGWLYAPDKQTLKIRKPGV